MKPHVLFASLLSALLLNACGGSSSDPDPAPVEDPLAAYKNQVVAWGTCDQYFPTDDPLNNLVAYKDKLGSRLQCANIQLPLDYQQPNGLRISLAVLRVLAADSPADKPNLLFNPGGPGGDGLKFSMVYSMLLSDGNPETPLGRKYQAMDQAYNFVGFSPRGVGASTQLICAGNELVYPMDITKWGDTADNISKLTSKARYIASNCQKSPIADFIRTDATARDMDVIRHLLGDSKLHYYGVSYGTWLGFWYAGLFPDTTGPMVLDSNMNFSRSIHDASILYKKGQAHTYQDFVAPYAARHNDKLGMGTATEDITLALNTLAPPVNQALLMAGGNFRAESGEIPSYIGVVKAAIETQKLRDQDVSLDDIHRRLTEDPYIIDAPLYESAFKEQAHQLLVALRNVETPGYFSQSETFQLDNSDSVWNTVVCNDDPINHLEQSYWTQTAFELTALVPLVNNEVTTQPCLHWTPAKGQPSKPAMSALQNVPLLMLQSQYDVPTPLSGAMETFDQLPTASMVYVENEGGHGVMVYQTECVDFTVMDYLLGTPPAQRLTSCQGKPLSLDAESAPSADKRKASGDTRTESPFLNPALAEQLLDTLRSATQR